MLHELGIDPDKPSAEERIFERQERDRNWSFEKIRMAHVKAGLFAYELLGMPIESVCRLIQNAFGFKPNPRDVGKYLKLYVKEFG